MKPGVLVGTYWLGPVNGILLTHPQHRKIATILMQPSYRGPAGVSAIGLKSWC